MKRKEPISKVEYGALQEAYDYFNAALFGNSLPHVFITMQRHAGSRGYFHAEIFEGRKDKVLTHELALNPDAFFDRTDREIFSTLAHEMAHVWQQECGTAPRRCYHDKEWSTKMKEIGLHPSDTGKPGGKETGQSMTHYIVDGGKFDKAFKKLEEKGIGLGWNGRTARMLAAQAMAGMGGTSVSGDEEEGKEPAKKTDRSKVKFTCPDCGMNAWAKETAMLICGTCYDVGGDIVTMEAA